MTEQNPTSDFIPRLAVRKLDKSLYDYEVSYGGQVLYAGGGQLGISEAIIQAIDTNPPFRGFEVEYDGYLVGTYTQYELNSDAGAVAKAAVATKAMFFEP